jgi:sugar lactone lactonase YvrE
MPEDETMKRSRLNVLTLVLLLAAAPFADAWIRSPAIGFATLPPGAVNPEGITADAEGNIYVTTFDPKGQTPGQLIVFSASGKLLRQVAVAGASPQLLGLAFHPITGSLLVIDFGPVLVGGAARVLEVDPNTGASSVFMTATGSAGLNALTFDAAGNVYVSDSFQGIVWKTGPAGGAGTAWLTDALLTTTAVPPFGANGLAFNRAGDTLFVANTGNDTVVQVPVSAGAAGMPSVFVNSINGADGLLVDDEDNIWIAANQADEIVVLDPTGRAIAKLGDFDGLDPKGAPVGLLFPASIVFSHGFLYATNLALDLRLFGLAQTGDSQWTEKVKRYTVSRIRAQIPPVRGD